MRPFLAAAALYVAAWALLPFPWTHSLSDQCAWHVRPWARSLGFIRAGEDYTSVAVCRERRGLKSPSPFLKVVLRSWPHENDHALPPRPAPRAVQTGDRR